MRTIIAAALCFVFSEIALPAYATEQQELGTFRDWRAFSFTENGSTVCTMTSRPQKMEHGGRPRGDVYAFITHRPSQNSLYVVSFIAGYTFEPGSEVTVEIGNETFRLFTEGDGAWARDEKTDRDLTSAIRRGARMVVKGKSSRGTSTTDTYSLSGSGSALDAISKACNVKS